MTWIISSVEPTLIFEIDIASNRSMFDRLVEISQNAFSGAPWNISAPQQPLVKQLLSNPSARLFVARRHDEAPVAGFSVGSVVSPRLLEFLQLPSTSQACVGDYHLTWRAVHPIHRGFGLGQMLTKARLDDAALNNCPVVYGETLRGNLGTVAMHRAMGFEFYHSDFFSAADGLYEKVYFRKRLFRDSEQEMLRQ